MKNGSWYIIGLMSGTSLDGLDIAYIKFTNSDYFFYEIIYATTLPYSTKWKTELKNAYHASAVEITKLNSDYGRFLGESVLTFMSQFAIEKVDFVASHGQTIFHNPNEGYTLQIGNGATLAATCRQKVICDFRTQDVALGGQGAPLVPIGDRILFSQYDYCINIGGFANISLEHQSERLAFDICPANIVLNTFAEKLGKAYDENGNIAKNASLHEGLLVQLNNMDFYQNRKSMGFEIVQNQVLPLIDSFHLSPEIILRTYTEHIAIQIAKHIQTNAQVLITGGGALNQFLMHRIHELAQVRLVIPDRQLIDFKEALIFGLLGLLRNEGEINCLKSVTGASQNHSSGVVYNP
ncbi:MAG: anhydro-N-acetylmuramic acid kinase [Flavobacteriaceae bacterium]|nr:anhydro-N-acetylmuramic acid kinase [Flavobacteriaceae bacterium]